MMLGENRNRIVSNVRTRLQCQQSSMSVSEKASIYVNLCWFNIDSTDGSVIRFCMRIEMTPRICKYCSRC